MSPRLCMVVHGPYPVGEPRVARQAAVAVAEGWDVDIIAMRREQEPREELVDGARVIRLPIEHRRGANAWGVIREYVGFFVLAAAWLTMSGTARRYRVVHVHNPPDFLVAVALVPRLLGARIVLDIHDLSPDMFAMRFSGRLADTVSRGLRLIERLATGFADAVITVHEPYRRELVTRRVRPEKIVVVMNALDERLLPTTPTRTSPTPRIVYHGTLTPPYGIELLVEAFARIAPIVAADLQIEGEGDSAAPARNRALQLGLAERVQISGRYLAQREVLVRVQGASVGVIPNLRTPLNRFALSSKLFEYVVLGIPVVASRLPTIEEHFGPNEVRFFEPGNAESLADAMLDVLTDPVSAAERARTARVRYERYRWTDQAARYARLLASLGGVNDLAQATGVNLG